MNSNPDKNIVISPASVKSALALVLEGANGSSAQQIVDALKLSNSKSSTQELHDQLQSLQVSSDVLPSVSMKFQAQIFHWFPYFQAPPQLGVTLKSENRLFVANDEKLKPEYVQQVQRKYNAGSQSVDFKKSEKASEQINNWVSEATKGLISSISSPGTGLMVLFLYIYASGEVPF